MINYFSFEAFLKALELLIMTMFCPMFYALLPNDKLFLIAKAQVIIQSIKIASITR
tara:strand:- start:19 stop:186 length:168 start_codon:yes stop_codon:yes gene_type:complete